MKYTNSENYNEALSNLSNAKRDMVAWCDKMYNEFCDEHFCVLKGGKFFIGKKKHDECGHESIEYMTKKDFMDFYNNITYYELVKKNDGYGIREYKPAKVWFSSHERQSYEGVIFDPAKKAHNMYNTWKGFFVKGQEGQWDMIRNHFYEVWCKGNDKHFEYLMKWFAHIVQHPEQKPGVAIVVKGEKGTGKSMIVDKIFSKILGNMYIPVSKAHHVIGKFNSQLDGKLLLLMEEAVWAGDKASEGAIKTLITEDKIAIEGKGVDTEIKKSYLRVMYISNEKRAVPATLDERRFFALTTSNKYKGDYEYFEKLAKAIDVEIPAFMFYLEHLDLGKSSDILNAPKTETLFEDIVEGMDSVYRWLYDFIVICQGEKSSLLDSPIRTSTLWDMFQNYLKNERDCSSYKPNSEVKSHKKLTMLLRDKLGFCHVKIKMHYYIDFGGIENAKRAFESICPFTTWENPIIPADKMNNYGNEYSIYKGERNISRIDEINDGLSLVVKGRKYDEECMHNIFAECNFEEFASEVSEREPEEISNIERLEYEKQRNKDFINVTFKKENHDKSAFAELEKLAELDRLAEEMDEKERMKQ